MHVLGKTARHMHTRASTIYGGAREVQKNIIAKLAFGL
jgi:alkylation response protein AidB-like acyl-CoA dehydrogenase